MKRCTGRIIDADAAVDMGLALKSLPVDMLHDEAIFSCMDTEDWHEGVRSFAEKRKPDYRGR
jgi:enoyl-CoA hydratase/carnithine racemase